MIDSFTKCDGKSKVSFLFYFLGHFLVHPFDHEDLWYALHTPKKSFKSCLCLFLSVCLFVYVCLTLCFKSFSLCLSVCLYLYLSLSLYLCVCLLRLAVYTYLFISICLSITVSSLSVCLSVCLSVWLPFLSGWLSFVCLAVCLVWLSFVWLSPCVCLFAFVCPWLLLVCLSVCLCQEHFSVARVASVSLRMNPSNAGDISHTACTINCGLWTAPLYKPHWRFFVFFRKRTYISRTEL